MQPYEQETIDHITRLAKAAGFRVFIAERGNYGFYTDQEGTAVVCFQVNGCDFRLSGNYRPYDSLAGKYTGTGWIISDTVPADKGTLISAFKRYPPRWATGCYQVSRTTLQQHQAAYQDSSRYQEI